MDPRLEHRLQLTRRQFFGSAQRRASARRRWRRCWATRRAADAGATRRLPGLPHFAPKAKRVIYLFQSGGAVADGPVRLQAAAGRSARHGAARLDPQGPAADRHDLDAGELSGRAVRCSSSPSTGRSARGSASCCRTRRRSPTSCASSSRCTPRRSITIPAITFFQTGAQLAGRPSIGVVAVLRPGQREPATCRRSS